MTTPFRIPLAQLATITSLLTLEAHFRMTSEWHDPERAQMRRRKTKTKNEMGGVRDMSARKQRKTKMNPLGSPPDAVFNR